MAAVVASSVALAAEGDFVIRDFAFRSGEKMEQLSLHYRTLGTPAIDAAGMTRNAVLILHGTGGSGAPFLNPSFAGELFGPGQPLDQAKYFLIIPDSIGHGRSSKPSDALRGKFPHYRYADMIEAQYRLLKEHLHVNHLRLVMGTSMGGMHTWLWGTAHPDFMDALLPLASLPVEIAGLNRIRRKLTIDAIRNDPEWKNGEYEKQPSGFRTAISVSMATGGSPLQWMREAPTREAADAAVEKALAERFARGDANNTLYAVESSEDYAGLPLEKITAALTAINSADDLTNPPELKIAEREISRVKRGKFVLLPITDATRGHGTHSLPKIWKSHLVDLMNASEPTALTRVR